jgi:enamine deaminase RidA (YjgF/YER057c/UK114 family)
VLPDNLAEQNEWSKNHIKTDVVEVNLLNNRVVDLLRVYLAEEKEACANNAWQTLVDATKKAPKSLIVGSWDTTYWTGPESPGRPQDFIKWGIKLKAAHPEFFTLINANGDLIKPGYQDEKHRGKHSIDYSELVRVTKEIANQNLLPTIGLFIHNFENVSESALEKFFARYSKDLKRNNIPEVILLPAWEIQGEWPAWEDGATRDCYIDPKIFNEQMRKIIKARNKVGAKNIKIAVALAAGFNDKYLNKQGKTGADYLEGLRACDIIGIDFYPTKEKGPKAAFEDAKKLWSAVGGQKPFAIFEYSIETYDWINEKPIAWTEQEKIEFIKQTYKLWKEYPFVDQIYWWFIGRGEQARIIMRGLGNGK